MHEKIKLNAGTVDVPIIIHQHGLEAAAAHIGYNMQYSDQNFTLSIEGFLGGFFLNQMPRKMELVEIECEITDAHEDSHRTGASPIKDGFNLKGQKYVVKHTCIDRQPAHKNAAGGHGDDP